MIGWLIRRLKKRAVRKFQIECLHIPCGDCPNFIADGIYGKCRIAIKYGLERE